MYPLQVPAATLGLAMLGAPSPRETAEAGATAAFLNLSISLISPSLNIRQKEPVAGGPTTALGRNVSQSLFSKASSIVKLLAKSISYHDWKKTLRWPNRSQQILGI
ncbi:hypothetical protein NYO67_2930 [Aspergillus flavus]|nr:hypothetical protein NYO67_2930 [Aspergillus flavus]